MSQSLDQWRPRRWFPAQVGLRAMLCLCVLGLGAVAGGGVAAGMLAPTGGASPRGEVIFAAQGLESPDAVRARAIEDLREQGVAAQIPADTPARAATPPALNAAGPAAALAGRLRAAGLDARVPSAATPATVRIAGLGAALAALLLAWLCAFLLGRRLASGALGAEPDRLSLLAQAGAEPEALRKVMIGALARWCWLFGASGVGIGAAAALVWLRRHLTSADVLQTGLWAALTLLVVAQVAVALAARAGVRGRIGRWWRAVT